MIGNQAKQRTDSFSHIIKPRTYINGIINTKRITPGPDEPTKLIQSLKQYPKQIKIEYEIHKYDLPKKSRKCKVFMDKLLLKRKSMFYISILSSHK